MAGIFYKLGRLASNRPKLFLAGVMAVPLLYVSCGQLGDYADKVYKNSTEKSEAEIKAKAKKFAEQRNAEHLARVNKKCIDDGAVALENAKAHMKSGDTKKAADAIAECACAVGAASEVSTYAAAVAKLHQEQLSREKTANDSRIEREKKENEKLIARARAEDAKRLAAEKRKQGVAIGMSAADVLASSWGKPQKVNTTTTAYGVREQWVYGGGNYLYFENGVLKTIQN